MKIDSPEGSGLVPAEVKVTPSRPSQGGEGRGHGWEETQGPWVAPNILRPSMGPADSALTLGHSVPRQAPSSLPVSTPVVQGPRANLWGAVGGSGFREQQFSLGSSLVLGLPRPRCSERIYDPSVGVKARDCATQGNDACAVNSATGGCLVPVPDSVRVSVGSPSHTSPLRPLLQSPAEVTSQPRASAIPASDDVRGL